MPIKITQLPDRDLICAEVTGTFRLRDYTLEISKLAKRDGTAAATKAVVNFSDVRAYEFDTEKLLKTQPKKRITFPENHQDIRVAYIAPRFHLFDLAALIVRAWANQSNVTTTIVENEADALRFLGQPERSIADLLATSSDDTSSAASS